MFDNLITPEFKQIFNNSIDTLLSQHSLSVPCLLTYNNSKKDLCYNCEFDAISNRSSNMPKIDAVVNFPRFTMCPVCNGFGYIDTSTQDSIYLAIIFDSKYWLNWNSKTVKIADNMIQTISKIDLLPKIKGCKEMIINSNLSAYDNYRYALAGDPEPVGLGSHDYIVCMWTKS